MGVLNISTFLGVYGTCGVSRASLPLPLGILLSIFLSHLMYRRDLGISKKKKIKTKQNINYIPGILQDTANYKSHITVWKTTLLNKDKILLSVCEGLRPVSPTYYRFGCTVDLVVLLFHLVCVDRSGSLSGGAFNQLKLVTLSIVLTILYLLKTVLQRSLLQCHDSLYKSDEVL